MRLYEQGREAGWLLHPHKVRHEITCLFTDSLPMLEGVLFLMYSTIVGMLVNVEYIFL